MNHYLGLRPHAPSTDPPVPKASNLARVSVLQDNQDRARIESLVADVRRASAQSTAVDPLVRWPVEDAVGGEVLIWTALVDPHTNRPRFFLRHQRRTFVVDVEFDPETHRRGASGKCLLHRREQVEQGWWTYGLCLFYVHDNVNVGPIRRCPERLHVYLPHWLDDSESQGPVLVRISPTRYAIRNQDPFVALRYDKTDFTMRDRDNRAVFTVGPRRRHLAHGVVYFCRPDMSVIRAAQATRPSLWKAAEHDKPPS